MVWLLFWSGKIQFGYVTLETNGNAMGSQIEIHQLAIGAIQMLSKYFAFIY